MVDLRSRYFTGLGFNVCGNIRDGIFIKDLLHHGPAGQSGQIRAGGCLAIYFSHLIVIAMNRLIGLAGDRISALRVSFRHMVLEDAMTILSYASPYEVQLELERGSGLSSNSTGTLPSGGSLESGDGASGAPAGTGTAVPATICHPFYRSCSSADLTHVIYFLFSLSLSL